MDSWIQKTVNRVGDPKKARKEIDVEIKQLEQELEAVHDSNERNIKK